MSYLKKRLSSVFSQKHSIYPRPLKAMVMTSQVPLKQMAQDFRGINGIWMALLLLPSLVSALQNSHPSKLSTICIECFSTFLSLLLLKSTRKLKAIKNFSYTKAYASCTNFWRCHICASGLTNFPCSLFRREKF